MSGLISVECWNLKKSDSWVMVAPLCIRRSSVGIAVLDNHLYASKSLEYYYVCV